MSEKNKKNTILDYDINYLNAPFYLVKFSVEIQSGKATAMTYLCISLIYSMYGLNKESCFYALKSIRLDRKNAYAWYAAGSRRRELGMDFSKCKKYFLKSLELNGEKPYIPLYELVVCEANEANYPERAKYEKMFLEIDSKDSGYFLRRAYINDAQGRIKEAFKDFFRAVRQRIFNHNETDPGVDSFFPAFCTFVYSGITKIMNPGVAEAYEANFLLNLGHEREGIDLMFEAVRKTKKQSEKETCYKNLLDFFYDREEYKKCIDVANRILIREKFVEAYGYKAFSYRELGEFEKAREALHLARKYGSEEELENSSYYNSLALTYFCEGDYGKAINWLNKQIITEPSAHPFLYKGFCLEELDELDGAIKAYNKANEYQPDDLAYYRVANLYYIKSDFENALKSINQSLMLKKDSYNYSLKGDILTAMKRIKEARMCYKIAEGLE